MIRIIAVLVVSIFFTKTGYSQSDSLRLNYIQPYPDKFFIWPVIKERKLSFSISDRDDSSNKLDYKPNSTYSLGMGAYVFDVLVELSFAIPIGERSLTTYGASEVRDLQSNILGKYWGIDFYHQNYSGFYVANPDPTAPEAFIKREDIGLINKGVSGVYAFSKNKFSLKAAYNYSERQVKSAGSFVISGSVNSLNLEADSSISSQISSSVVSSTTSFEQFKYTGLSLVPGYTYTYVYKSFFLNGVFSYGPTHYWIQYKAKDQSTQYDISINTFADIRISIGYNSDRFFGGLSYRVQTREVRFEDVRFSNSSSTLRFLVGVKINESGIFKKRAQDIFSK